MSRSYRKQPVWKDRATRGGKTAANRRLRKKLKQNYELNLQNKSYRKIYDSWDICDYCSLIDNDFEKYYRKYLIFCRGMNNPPTRKEVYKQWIKWYKGK